MVITTTYYSLYAASSWSQCLSFFKFYLAKRNLSSIHISQSFFFLNEEENHREERHSTEKNVRARDGDPKSEPRWRGGLHQDRPRDGDPRSEARWLRGLHQDRPRGGGEAEPSCRTFRLWGRHKAMVQQTKAGKCNS